MNRVLYYDTRYCNLNLICPRYNYATEGGCPFTVRSIKDRNSIPRSLRVLDSYSRFRKGLFKKFIVTLFLKFFKVRNTKMIRNLRCLRQSIRTFNCSNLDFFFFQFVPTFLQQLLINSSFFFSSGFFCLLKRNFLPLTANLLNLNLYLSVQLQVRSRSSRVRLRLSCIVKERVLLYIVLIICLLIG